MPARIQTTGAKILDPLLGQKLRVALTIHLALIARARLLGPLKRNSRKDTGELSRSWGVDGVTLGANIVNRADHAQYPRAGAFQTAAKVLTRRRVRGIFIDAVDRALKDVF